MEPLLRVNDLVKHRGQRSVLKGLNLSIDRGEVVGLVGANGAGKTTLIATLAGLVPIEEGSITLNGEPYRPDSAGEAQAAGVSIIEQNFQVPSGLTVSQAIFRNTFLASHPEDELRGHAQRLLSENHIELDLGRATDELDRADQALLETLRVMAEEAQLVVFDEVVVTLGDDDVARLHEAIRKLKSRGCAAIYIAHRLEEVRALADRILVLREGRVVNDLLARHARLEDLTKSMFDKEIEYSREPEDHEINHIALTVDSLSVGEAVRNVSFSARAGEVLGVVGLRSSGVQQLMDALAGTRECTFDWAQLNGRELDSFVDEEAIAYLSTTEDARQGEQSISDIAASATEESEVLRLRDSATRVHEWGLSTSNIHSKAKTLSGGDRQRLSLGALLTHSDADLILLNHPTRGIDLNAKNMVLEQISEVLSKGRAVIIASNDLTEILQVAHRVLVMRNGQITGIVENANAHEDLIMSLAGEPQPQSFGSRSL
jgi:ABC-type sugar transport system ATPase subunit